MYCKECGREVPAGEDVCPFCGQSVEEDPAKQRAGKYLGMFSIGLSFISPLLGIILGSVGASKSKAIKYRPGIVLNTIGLIFSCLILLINLLSPVSTAVEGDSVNAIAVALSPVFLLFL